MITIDDQNDISLYMQTIVPSSVALVGSVSVPEAISRFMR